MTEATMKKVQLRDGASANIVQENVRRLQELFPEAFSEGANGKQKVDFDTLRQLLGDMQVLNEGEERYGLNWHGKKQARQIALTPPYGTLLPCPEESMDWDTTQNLFIEGDNLEVLKILRRSYANQVKMIYIDPPYNTGKEFIYPDKFQDNLDNYLKYTGQKDDEGLKLISNTEASGRKHTNWLNMMYPRLELAKDLLRNDGVIFISIDDNELEHLEVICKEIFGEENHIATLIWDKQHSQQQGMFKRYHEYVILLAKNAEEVSAISGGEGFIEAGALKKISRANPESEFTFPAGTRFDAPDDTILRGAFGGSEKVKVVKGQLLAKNGKVAEEVTLSAGWTQKKQMESWFRGKETLDTRGQKIIEFYFNSTGKLKCRKERRRITPSTLLPKYGMVSDSSKFLADLMGADVFSTPKPVKMIEDFIAWFTDDDDLIIDFFAGSSTTAHSCINQNFYGGKSNRFIMIQLPEVLDIDKPEQKTSAEYCLAKSLPTNIAELSKERIRRAAKKIKDKSPDYAGDLGFKVFKLSTSNIKVWNPDRKNMERSLLDNQNHLVEGRSEQDVLYELLLKRGVDLTTPIESREIAGKNVYSIGYGKIITCLDDLIAGDEVEPLAFGIIEWQSELKDTLGVKMLETHVFFKDSAFRDDIAKTNMVTILYQSGIKHVRSL